MATLNTSSESGAITRSYKSVVDCQIPSNAAPTFAKWVVLHASAPLASTFQADSSKESVLKVQSTGEGDLSELSEEFNDGRIQYAYAKVKDPNSGLPKSILIAWCGEGVPERTKGYFTTHTATVSNLLHGYHVQITARNDSQLEPEAIMKKVADASGAKYAGDTAPTMAIRGPPPSIASKPAFTPSRVGGAASDFKPLGSARNASSTATNKDDDDDGWGADAPRLTRNHLEKVESAYKPTTVNMKELTSQKLSAPAMSQSHADPANADVVKGGYQPIGKVDIAEIRRQAQQSGRVTDDRPSIVRGAYEPVGKVDIAAIRAKAQGPGVATPPSSVTPVRTGNSARSNDDGSDIPSLADRASAFTASERISSMPKPKIANKFGGSSFVATKAPAPGSFESKPNISSTAPVGAASKSFADQGGKTPAQVWAERKAREGTTTTNVEMDSSAPAISGQTSGGSGGWQSGYSGKKWGTVGTARLGQTTLTGQRTGDETPDNDTQNSGIPNAGVSSIRDRFNEAPTPAEPARAATPPPMDLSSKPNAVVEVPPMETRAMPPPPAQPPRPEDDEDEDETDYRPSSPVRIVQPVARSQEKPMEPVEELKDQESVPSASIARVVPPPQQLDDEPLVEEQDIARTAGQSAAAASLGHQSNPLSAQQGNKRAKAEYDYEKAEDNEIGFDEGEIITNIDMVDEDWWMGTNNKGDSGLFPANYVSLIEDEAPSPVATDPTAAAQDTRTQSKPTATAEYDYEAAEDNELSFPEGATITDVEFPDEDWWMGRFSGREGLFPANYVKLDQ